MRIFGALVIGSLLAAPTQAQTQAPTFAEMVGDWSRKLENGKDFVFSLRADSTFQARGIGTAQVNEEDRPVNVVGRWRMVGDTMAVSKLSLQISMADGETMDVPEDQAAEGLQGLGDLSRRVKLQHDTLTTSKLDGTGTPLVYQRVKAAPKATP